MEIFSIIPGSSLSSYLHWCFFLFLCLLYTHILTFFHRYHYPSYIQRPPQGTLPLKEWWIKVRRHDVTWRSLCWKTNKDVKTLNKIKMHIKMDAGKSRVQVLFLATLALNWSDCWSGRIRVNKDSDASTFLIKWQEHQLSGHHVKRRLHFFAFCIVLHRWQLRSEHYMWKHVKVRGSNQSRPFYQLEGAAFPICLLCRVNCLKWAMEIFLWVVLL